VEKRAAFVGLGFHVADAADGFLFLFFAVVMGGGGRGSCLRLQGGRSRDIRGGGGSHDAWFGMKSRDGGNALRSGVVVLGREEVVGWWYCCCHCVCSVAWVLWLSRGLELADDAAACQRSPRPHRTARALAPPTPNIAALRALC